MDIKRFYTLLLAGILLVTGCDKSQPQEDNGGKNILS